MLTQQMSLNEARGTLVPRFFFVTVVFCCALASPMPAAAQQQPTGAQLAAAMEQTLVEAIARAEKSVVAIARIDTPDARAAEREQPGLVELARPKNPFDPDYVPDYFATGVVIGARGLILTQYHVVAENAEHFVSTVDRKVYRARVKAADPRSDLAVLEIDAKDLKPITLGDASKLRKGQIAIALGNPYAIARDGQASASWGIIANLARKAPPPTSEDGTRKQKDKLYHFGTLIQTDAKLNLGTSGGALVNLKGEMIGLTTSMAAISGYEQAAGYAIGVDDVFRQALKALEEGREVEYGLLGLQPTNLTPQDRAAGLSGVRISDVPPGTPADRAGLLVQDIITHLDGEAVQDADALILNVSKRPVESRVRVTVLRDRRAQRIDVELGKAHVPGHKIVTATPPLWRGILVDYSTAVPSEEMRRVRRTDLMRDGCVLVTQVEKDSPAWQAQLQPGMFVTHVAGTKVRTPKEFRTAILGKDGPVELTVFAADSTKGAETRVIKPAG
jgi:S1-C subfamily serine protease